MDPMLDYTDEFVIRKVVGLDGFPEAVEHIIECVASAWTVSNSPAMMCAIKIFIVGDLHRSSVTSACAESQLNSLVHSHVGPGYAPLRAWNCNWFSFNKCSGSWTWQQQADNIRDWVRGGWELTVAPATEIAMFGYAAATKSSSSSKNWKQLGMRIEGEHLRIWHESAWHEESPPQDRDRPARKRSCPSADRHQGCARSPRRIRSERGFPPGLRGARRTRRREVGRVG